MSASGSTGISWAGTEPAIGTNRSAARSSASSVPVPRPWARFGSPSSAATTASRDNPTEDSAAPLMTTGTSMFFTISRTADTPPIGATFTTATSAKSDTAVNCRSRRRASSAAIATPGNLSLSARSSATVSHGCSTYSTSRSSQVSAARSSPAASRSYRPLASRRRVTPPTRLAAVEYTEEMRRTSAPVGRPPTFSFTVRHPVVVRRSRTEAAKSSPSTSGRTALLRTNSPVLCGGVAAASTAAASQWASRPVS